MCACYMESLCQMRSTCTSECSGPLQMRTHESFACVKLRCFPLPASFFLVLSCCQMSCFCRCVCFRASIGHLSHLQILPRDTFSKHVLYLLALVQERKLKHIVPCDYIVVETTVPFKFVGLLLRDQAAQCCSHCWSMCHILHCKPSQILSSKP